MPFKKEKHTASVSTKEAIAELFQKLDECELDPITELATLAQDPNVPLTERIGILKTLMSYTTPKRKAVDFIRENDEEGLTVRIVKYSKSDQPVKKMIAPESVTEEDLTGFATLKTGTED